jgi:hypothetical protein
MPLVNISCFLCGSPIDESDRLPNWMGQFRALYTVLKEWDSARVSRVSERRPESDLVPLDESITKAVEHLDLAQPTIDGDSIKIHLSPTHFGEPYPPPPPLTPQPVWGFALHASCWSLLMMNYPRLKSEPAACVQALFDLCRSQPISRGTIDWGHDYGGLFHRTSESHELLLGEDDELERTEPLPALSTYDPFHVSQLSAQIPTPSSLRGTQSVSRSCFNDQMPANRSVDPFHRLPLEIATEIIMLLSSTDVVSLRLASKTFARMTLLDCFWRSRFWPGREFSYLFEYASLKHVPARELFDTVRSLQHHPAVSNRRRVWSLASFISNLAETRRASSPCGGVPCQSFFEPNANPDEKKWLVAQGTISDAEKCFSYTNGSRVLYNRLLSLGTLNTEGWVSSVNIGDKSYISGFRLIESGGKVLQFGYRQPRQEVQIHWPDNTPQTISLSGVEVVLDSRGIRALRYSTSCGIFSSWVGEHEGLPKTRLVAIDTDHSSPGLLKILKGGFDVSSINTLFKPGSLICP